MSKTRTVHHNHRIGFWNAVRDIGVASINKGQIGLIFIGLSILVTVIKTPGEKLAEIASLIIHDLQTMHLVGYAYGVIMTFGWFWHAKRQRRVSHAEMQRMGEEKTALQEMGVGGSLPSSGFK